LNVVHAEYAAIAALNFNIVRPTRHELGLQAVCAFDNLSLVGHGA